MAKRLLWSFALALAVLVSDSLFTHKTFADCAEISAILGSSGANPDPQRDRWAQSKTPPLKAAESASEIPRPRSSAAATFEFAHDSPIRWALVYIGINYVSGVPTRAQVDAKLRKVINEYLEQRKDKDAEYRDLALDRRQPILQAIDILNKAGLTTIDDSI